MTLQEHFENFKAGTITETCLGLPSIKVENGEYVYIVHVSNKSYIQNPKNLDRSEQACFNVEIHKRGVSRKVDVGQLLKYLNGEMSLEDWTNHLTSSGKLLDYIKQMRENTKKRLLAELESL
jgi:hypothetical protein